MRAVLATTFLCAALGAHTDPTAKHNIVDTAIAAGSFKTLAKALGAAQLVDTLKGEGPFTVFAPTDEAFAKLDKKTLSSLLKPENRAQLQRILTYHVVPTRALAVEALATSKLGTVAGPELRIGLDGGQVEVQNAKVVATDIECSNGVIHVIDTVLLPPASPKPKGDKFVGVGYETTSAALASQLHVRADRSLLLTKITRGSNAEKFGLKRYDLVVKIAGRSGSRNSLRKAIAEGDYGEEIEFELFRQGKPMTLMVPIGERH